MCGGAGFSIITPREMAEVFVVNPSKQLIQKVYDYFHPTAVKEAIDLANKILSVYPNHQAALLRRGKLKIITMDFLEALEDLTMLLKLNDNVHYLAHFSIGWLYLKASMWQKAKEHFTLAIMQYDSNLKLDHDFLERSRQVFKNVDLYVDEKVENVSSMIKGWFGVQSTPVAKRKEDNNAMNTYLDYRPSLLDCYMMRASCNLNLQNSSEALADFESCLAYSSKNSAVSQHSSSAAPLLSTFLLHYNIGLLHFFNLRHKDAISHFDKALESGKLESVLPRIKNRTVEYKLYAKQYLDQGFCSRLFLRMLPQEIIMHALSFADDETIGTCATASQYLHEMIIQEYTTLNENKRELPLFGSFQKVYNWYVKPGTVETTVMQDLNRVTAHYGQNLVKVKLENVFQRILPPLSQNPRMLVTQNVRELEISYSGVNADYDYDSGAKNLPRIIETMNHFFKAFPRLEKLTVDCCPPPTVSAEDDEAEALLFSNLKHFKAKQLGNCTPHYVTEAQVLQFLKRYGKQLQTVILESVGKIETEDDAKQIIIPLCPSAKIKIGGRGFDSIVYYYSNY